MKRTKFVLSILTLLLFNNVFGQVLDRDKEIEKIFFDLPINSNLTTLLNAANASNFCTESPDWLIPGENYFTCFFSVHDYFKLQPRFYQMEIFTSGKGYGIAGRMLDTVLVISINANYGDGKNDFFTKDVEEQYEEFINRFKELSVKASEFRLSDGSSLDENGYYFFRKKEKVPYLTISLDNYGRLHIMYIRVDKW